MRRSRTATAESKRRIVTEAARMVRERGPDGVSVTEVMAAAGMTHGGFYAHFPSKDALIAAAMTQAFEDRLRPLAPAEGDPPADTLRRWAAAYLSPQHVGARDVGCPIAALGCDAVRSEGPLRDTMADGVRRTLAAIAGALPQSPDREARAAQLLASALGAVMLARALGEGGEGALVLDAVRSGELFRSLAEPASDGAPSAGV